MSERGTTDGASRGAELDGARAAGARPDDSSAPSGTALDGDERPGDRADRLQERLAVPVLVAALASVPAVFLTLFEGPAQMVGAAINGLSGLVLIAETLALLAVSENRLRWARENLWLVALALVMVPAVIFAVGPVQLLRVLRVGVRMVGALRIIRVGRILKAGRIVRERAGLDQTWQRFAGFAVSLLVAGFVVVILSDPSSQSRQLLDDVIDVTGPVPVVLAGLVLGAATLVVMLSRRDAEPEGEGERAGATPAEDGRRPGLPEDGARGA